MKHSSAILTAAALSRAIYAQSTAICQAVAPAQTSLGSVQTAELNLPGRPFGIAFASQQPDTAFVALNFAGGSGDNSNGEATGLGNSSLGVLDTATSPPTLRHQIPIPDADAGSEGALGLAITHGGEYVVVAAGTGALIFDAAAAAIGSTNALVGVLNGTSQSQNPGNAAIEVTISPDDRYAFVSQEYGADSTGDRLTPTPGNVDVFRLDGGNGTAVGYQNLGFAVVGTSISPDGKTMYATSENATLGSAGGALTVLDLATLESSPAKSRISSILAGCAPVRTIVSSDGTTVWVTARESNRLLAFDATKLAAKSPNAQIASVQVGTAPVGLTFVANGSLIITADSNRFNASGATTGLSVVDVDAALAGKSAMIGRIPTGLFPRELATSADGKTLLVSDNVSQQVQVVDLTTLPTASSAASSVSTPSSAASSNQRCLVTLGVFSGLATLQLLS